MVERWFVYVLRCADGSLYTGITKDVGARVAQHGAGKGAKYTRGRGPLEVCAVRRCMSKGMALRLELAMKALSRKEKETRITTTVALAAFARKFATKTRGTRMRSQADKIR